MGHLPASDDTTPANLRRAMVYGSAMGSFAVEAFSVQRFDELTRDQVSERVRAFSDLVRFDIPPMPEAV